MSVETFAPKAPNVSMTERAVKHTRKQIAAASAKAVRLGVKKAGCSGFKYVLDLLTEIDASLIAFAVADDVTVYVAPADLPYVQGTEIDYSTEGLNSTLKFRNPNAKDECGCGESFNVDTSAQ